MIRSGLRGKDDAMQGKVKLALGALIILALAAAFFRVPQTASPPRPGADRSAWLPEYAGALGVTLDTGPSTGKTVDNVTARVVDPDKLKPFGFHGVKKGHRLVLMNLGNGNWLIKMLGTREQIAVNLYDQFAPR